MITTITLGGYPLDVVNLVEWVVSAGAEPSIAEFVVNYHLAEKLLGEPAGPIALVINDITWQGLHLLPAEEVSDDLVRLRVGDRRVLWRERWVTFVANLRRKAPDERLSTEGTRERTNLPDTDRFFDWTLKERSAPYTAIEVVRALLDLVEGAGSWTDEIKSPEPEVHVQDVVYAGYASEVLAAACAAALVSIAPDRTGKIRLFRLDDGSEERALEGIDHQARNPDGSLGHVFRQDNWRARGTAVRVLFRPRLELRGDYDAESGATHEDGDLYLDNVWANTDDALVADGKTWCQGEVHTADEFFGAWETDARDILSGEAYPSHETVQTFWFGGLMFINWAGMGIPGAHPDVVWAARVQAIVESYRQEFRFPKWWADRMLDLRAERLAVVDGFGVRSPSPVYANYAMISMAEAAAARGDEAEDHPAFWNVDSWDDDLANATKAPASLSVVNQEQAIIKASFGVKGGFGVLVVPSAVEAEDGKTLSSHAGTEGIIEDLILSDDHRFATVVCAVPAIPDRFFEVTVPYAGISHPALPGGVKTNGRTVDVFCDLEEALFAWVDSDADKIKAVFDESQGSPLGSMTPINNEALLALADAAATHYYLSLRDILVGQLQLPGHQSIEPTGRIQQIRTMVSEKGVMTLVDLSEDSPAPDISDLLPRAFQRSLEERGRPAS